MPAPSAQAIATKRSIHPQEGARIYRHVHQNEEQILNGACRIPISRQSITSRIDTGILRPVGLDEGIGIHLFGNVRHGQSMEDVASRRNLELTSKSLRMNKTSKTPPIRYSEQRGHIYLMLL